MLRMTVFSTPFWKKLRLSLCSLALACLLPLAASSASAEGMTVKHAELIPTDEWYFLHTEFNILFSKPVEGALERGISLNFLVELDVTRPRWYWVDESIAAVRQNVRLSYHALTRQYHFSSNSGNQSFNSLIEAKHALEQLADWKVFDRSLLKKGGSYQAAVRVKLDVKQLPKPLQLEALGAKDWDLASDWFRFNLTP